MKTKSFYDLIAKRLTTEQISDIEAKTEKKVALLKAFKDKNNEAMLIEMKLSVPLYNFMKNLAAKQEMSIEDYIGAVLIGDVLDNVDSDIND